MDELSPEETRVERFAEFARSMGLEVVHDSDWFLDRPRRGNGDPYDEFLREIQLRGTQELSRDQVKRVEEWLSWDDGIEELSPMPSVWFRCMFEKDDTLVYEAGFSRYSWDPTDEVEYSFEETPEDEL